MKNADLQKVRPVWARREIETLRADNERLREMLAGSDKESPVVWWIRGCPPAHLPERATIQFMLPGGLVELTLTLDGAAVRACSLDGMLTVRPKAGNAVELFVKDEQGGWTG